MKLQEVACLNGRLGRMSEAYVSVDDRGFLFGDSVYEVARAYDGRIWTLDRHLDRLKRSLDAIRIESVDFDVLRRDILRTYEACTAVDALIYIQITRGVAPRSHVPDGPLTPTVLITARPFAGPGPAAYNEGVSVILVPELRWARRDIKSTNLLPNVLAKREAHERGAHEAIFVSDDGWVNEGSHSNFFIVRAGVVRTPPKGQDLLPGITRDLVVEIARGEGIPMEEAPVSREDLLGADEVFLTGTGSEVIGVVQVDDRPIGDGRVGPMTRRLLAAYRERVARGIE